MLPIEVQHAYKSTYVAEMQDLKALNESMFDAKKKELVQQMREYPTIDFIKQIKSLKNSETLCTSYYDALIKFDLAKAKAVHKTFKKQDNTFMNRQLFKSNKSKGIIIHNCDGADLIEGENEVTRVFAERMKANDSNRMQNIEWCQFIRKNCALVL